MKKIITISREFGSCGSVIGEKLADRLGYEYYDKAIILTASREGHIDFEEASLWDENAKPRLIKTKNIFEIYNKAMDERVFEHQAEVIKRMAVKGRCVLIGRNANMILKEYDSTLHVFIHANDYWRLMQLKERFPEIPEARLMDKIREVDRARKNYCNYFTNTEFGHAANYDITLSASTLGSDTCVDILYKLATEE